MSEPVLKVRGLTKVFQLPRRNALFAKQSLYAVNNVSFELHEDEVLGVVGESGCGKSTLGRLILRLIEPTEGDIEFMGADVRALPPRKLRQARARMQMVFQDPYGSLNPAMSVGEAIADTLRCHGVRSAAERRNRVLRMLNTVGLDEAHYYRFPHQLSGGQNQRVGIARALIINPKLIVMDEAVSALDVSVQAQILKLLEDIRSELPVSVIFISHDLNVVRRVSDRVIVLYMGRVMEIGPARELFAEPFHPYTKGLLASHPSMDPNNRRAGGLVLKGDLPSALDKPTGCPFVTRCQNATDICSARMPELRDISCGRLVACHNVGWPASPSKNVASPLSTA
jgi:oligopeptide transport system ATP-binding protein